MNETLQELLIRRLRELGSQRGDDKPMSLRQAYQRVPDGTDGRPLVSYETLRQIHTGVHSGKISDFTAEALAVVLRVDLHDVYEAAGQRRRLGTFVLPDKAEQLDAKERKVVLAVIDAILEGGQRERMESDQGTLLDDIAEAPSLRAVAHGGSDSARQADEADKLAAEARAEQEAAIAEMDERARAKE